MAALPPRTVVLGSPATPTHKVDPIELADLLVEIEAQANTPIAYIRSTLALLSAISGITDGEYGLVLSSASEAGIYERVSSAWVKRGSIPTIFTESTSATAAAASAAAASDSEDAAALSATSASNSASAAASSATDALAAAEASGDVLFYDTKADANSALGGLSEGQIVEVLVDESLSDRRTRYKVESSAFVFKVYLDGIRMVETLAQLDAATTSTPIYLADQRYAGVYYWDATVPLETHQSDTLKKAYLAPNAAADGAWVTMDVPDDLPAFDQIKTRMAVGRVDFVGIGDSNQVFGGNGWDYGIMYALTQSGFPMYATGLISMNENSANGAGLGYGYSYNGAAPVIGVMTGAPAFFDDYMDGLPLHEYGYLAAGLTYGSGGNSGMILDEGAGVAGLIDISAELQIDCYYGTFAAGSGGSFNPSIRRGTPPYNTLAAHGSITTTTGTDGVEVASFTLAAGSRAGFGNLGFKWNGADIVGPFFGTFVRISQTDRTAGFSYSTMLYLGGQSLRGMANTLINMSDTAIAHFLGEMRRLQGDQKTVVITVNSGLNDRNETNTSLGPAAVTDGDGAAAFVDNFIAIRNRIEAVWTSEGWPLRELFWLVFPSHPVDDPDDAELMAYRKAMEAFMRTVPRGQLINIERLTTEAEMLAGGWYNSGGADRNHLTSTGYAQLGLKLVEAMK